MNRPLTALFSALEALLVVGVGVGLPLVPLTLMWAVQYGLAIDYLVFWRGAVDTWLLGHGVDLALTLDPVIAASAGLPGAGDPFALTIAPLGFAVITVLLAVRAGRRIGETPHRHLGHLVAIGFVAMLSLLLASSVTTIGIEPQLVQAALLPTLVFALGIAIGSESSRRRLGRPDAAAERLRTLTSRIPEAARVCVALALRCGALAAALVLAVAAVLVGLRLATGYASIIALYEAVQSGVLGGIALTFGQLAFAPNLVVWGAAWLVGPGFSIGTGSSIGPLGSAVGPLPSIPLFGALPTTTLAWGFLGLLVPILAGFVAALVLRPALARRLGDRLSWPEIVGIGLGAGVVAGVVLGLLSLVSGGAAGPGRLAHVGPDALLVAAFAALEIGVPAVIALAVGRSRTPASAGVTRAERSDTSPGSAGSAGPTGSAGLAGSAGLTGSAEPTGTAELTGSAGLTGPAEPIARAMSAAPRAPGAAMPAQPTMSAEPTAPADPTMSAEPTTPAGSTRRWGAATSAAAAGATAAAGSIGGLVRGLMERRGGSPSEGGAADPDADTAPIDIVPPKP